MADEPTIDTLVLPVMEELLDCLCVALAGTLVGETCFCMIVPGQLVPMDYCGCGGGKKCGMGFVRLDSLYPSVNFPSPVADQRSCASPFAARFQVGAFRCIPTPKAGQSGIVMPTEEEQSTATARQLSDMRAMLDVLLCCLPGRKRSIGTYTPVGPNGDCGGGSWLVTYGL